VIRSTIALVCLASTLAACGGGSDGEPAPGPSPAAAVPANLDGIKEYLVQHTERLVHSVETLQRDAQQYHDLAESTNFEYARMLRDNREQVQVEIRELQAAYVQARPAYESMAGIVAGVPELAPHAQRATGRDGFAQVETLAFGTDPEHVAEGVEPDLDEDGKVTFPETLPDAKVMLDAAGALLETSEALDASAQKWQPTLEDAFRTLVVVAPTTSGYFQDWRNSRFVAGEDAEEEGFVANSRLADLRDHLAGLMHVYDSIQQAIETVDPQQALQTRGELQELHQFADRLFNEEQAGKKFTAEEADTLGAEAQRRAEAVAGQVSQAAGRLNLELET
jgi:hypothetical protein